MEKRIRFIINIVYFALLLLLIFFGCKYALPLLAPFLLAFVIAYLLRRPVAFLEKHLRLPHKAAAVLRFGSIGISLLVRLNSRSFRAITGFMPARSNARMPRQRISSIWKKALM